MPHRIPVLSNGHCRMVTGCCLQVVFVLYALYDAAKWFRSNAKFTPSWFFELLLDMLIVVCLVVVRPRAPPGLDLPHRTAP